MQYHTATDNQLTAKAPGKEGKDHTQLPFSRVGRLQQVNLPVPPPGLVKTALGTGM